MIPFFISIPHAGEKVPVEAPWLQNLSEPVLMCDVDRYVDDLYAPVIAELRIPLVKTEWHRYAIDLNRLPDDVDSDSVIGSPNASGTFPMGLHWVKTTTAIQLMKKPVSKSEHETLVAKYFHPFHKNVEAQYKVFRELGVEQVYHLDAHSMPSQGTAAHRDPGSKRPEIVVSDVDGKSCSTRYKDLVIAAYEKAGFQVSYNWPYKGGRVTQTYGQPQKGQNAIQVELNRSLYQNEVSKQKNGEIYSQTQKRIGEAVHHIFENIKGL